MYFGDEIYLTSVKYDLLVHASKQKFYPTASIQNQEILENTDGLGIDLPTSLRRPRVREINGSQDLNSFKINLYDHIDVDDEEDAKSLRSHQMFRLFSPEAESFLQASSDPEKSLHGVREDGFTPSHCLYLKRLGAIDINNTEYLSAKGLFVFESLNRRASSSIKYNEGIRIRHAISSKYLSCERSAQDFSIGLIFDTTGSEQSTIFFVVPAEKTDDSTVPSMVSTIRIEHELEDGRRVHLHSTSLFKSRLASSTKTPRGTSVVFSVEHHSEDMLKLFPASKEESLLIRKLVSKRAILHRCQFAMENCAALPSPHVVEPCIDLVLQLIDDVTRGEGFGQDLYKLTISEWIKKANSMLPTKFSALFSGKAVRHIQNKCVEIKVCCYGLVVSTSTRVAGSSFRSASSPRISTCMDGLVHARCLQSPTSRLADHPLAPVRTLFAFSFGSSSPSSRSRARRPLVMLLVFLLIVYLLPKFSAHGNGV